MKTELTLKELSSKINIPTNTIRRWCLKPIIGEVYNKDVWNIKEVRSQLKKYEDINFVEKVGCEIDEIELIKSKKSTTKSYVNLKDVEVGQTIILHNYSLEYTLTLKKIEEIDDTQIYIFKDEDKDEYKIYSLSQLSKSNIKFEEVE